MKRFTNILAVISGGSDDRRVSRRAFELAATNDARLTFCTTHDAQVPAVGVLKAAPTFRRINRMLREARTMSLEGAVAHAREKGHAAETQVLEGKPFVAIIQKVISDDHDLLLFPDDQAPSLHSRLFGSTATHLLRKCPCPVWVIKSPSTDKRRSRVHRVLAAVNAAGDSPSEVTLNRTILELASSLAVRESAELHVVHCWSVYGESILTGPRGFLSEPELEEHRRGIRRMHSDALNDLMAPFAAEGHKARKHLRKGDPGAIIPDLADSIDADVVVMGTVARTGVNGVSIGNTAEHVLQRVGRSVLAVKPQGFVGPVTVAESNL